MKICRVSFWYGQRLYCQRRGEKPRRRGARFVSARSIFGGPGFRIDSRFAESPPKPLKINRIAINMNGLDLKTSSPGRRFFLLAGITAADPQPAVGNKPALPSRRRFDPLMFPFRTTR
jgi:hypothetical protein